MCKACNACWAMFNQYENLVIHYSAHTLITWFPEELARYVEHLPADLYVNVITGPNYIEFLES